MDEFAILTNRKRAIIALVHSIVFLLIATWQLIAARPAQGMMAQSAAPTGTWALCGVYVVVSAVLLLLFAVSRVWIERAYFALCAASATSGLLRTVLGDHGFHSGRYLRVIMLMSAVIVGLMIARSHGVRGDQFVAS